MIRVDCSELTQDEQLALASTISDGLAGLGVALVNGEEILVDQIGKESLDTLTIVGLAKAFVSKRKDPGIYSVEQEGELLVVHSEEGFGERVKKGRFKVPPGAFQCPVCGAVLPDEGTYEHHLRVHDLVRGVR